MTTNGLYLNPIEASQIRKGNSYPRGPSEFRQVVNVFDDNTFLTIDFQSVYIQKVTRFGLKKKIFSLYHKLVQILSIDYDSLN